MGRVINPERASKERTHLVRGVILALRELMLQTDTDTKTRDLAAFIVLALEAIHSTIESSVDAWEKRGYWLKADRYRMEWAWAERHGSVLRTAVLNDDWPTVAIHAAQLAERLRGVDLPKRNTLGTPWVGAFERLKAGDRHT